jgi:5-methylcytosine-specific restriction endonuclease McrA
MELRTCKSCDEPKPVSEFYHRNGRPSHKDCKRCVCDTYKRARAAKARPKVNLVGQRFGDLVVLEKVPPSLVASVGLERPRGTAWLCVCACGRATYLHTAHLTSGNTKSCGCGKYSGSPENVKKAQAAVKITDRNLAGVNRIVERYKSNAAKQGREFSLSLDDVKRLVFSECHYCGIGPSNEMDLKHAAYRDGKPRDVIRYNGIDRVDNAIGYTLDNVVTCCKACNYAKHSRPLPEFQDWIRRVHARLSA